jgi:hypothetical protein
MEHAITLDGYSQVADPYQQPFNVPAEWGHLNPLALI